LNPTATAGDIDKVLEVNLVTVPSTSTTTGVPTASAITDSAVGPGASENFEAAFQEETELYEYPNNATSGPSPDGSPGAYDATQSILNNLPIGNDVHEDSTTSSGMGIPYAAILSSDLKTVIAGGLPVTLSNQNYTVNKIAWQHGKYPSDPAGQPPSTNGRTSGDNLYVNLTFSAASVAALKPNTVYAAYLLVRDTDVSGPLSDHLWYFETPPTVTPPTPAISLGYADTYRPTSGTGLPWFGMANTTVVGCGVDPDQNGPAFADTCPQEVTGGDSYDGGAILITNPSSTASITVTGPGSVTIPTPLRLTADEQATGNCVYTPWPGLNQTIPPGGSLVLTGTGLTGDPCGQYLSGNYDFDTSESNGNDDCTPTGAIPVINLTINGVAETITDSGQIINKGGFDSGGCSDTNEFNTFVPIPASQISP
jgi:hypothetical protein